MKGQLQRLDDADLVGDLERIEVLGEADVRLLLAVRSGDNSARSGGQNKEEKKKTIKTNTRYTRDARDQEGRNRA